MKMNKPLFTIITGTNGVGKSTFGKKFEEETKIPFINPDLHYKNKFGGYYDFTIEQQREASNELKQKREDFFKDKKSFAIERILDHESVISKLAKQAHENGFNTALIYIGVDRKEISNLRIENRLSEGAHNVDSDIVEKNLKDCIKCFKSVAREFDNVLIYDNSAHRNSNHFIKIYDRRNDHVKFEAAHKPKWAKDLIDNSFTLQKDKGIDLSK